MPPLVRTLLALLVAVLVAFAVIGAVEAINTRLHPAPSGFAMSDPAQFEAYIRALPVRALAIVLAGYALAALVAGAIAARVAPVHPGRHALLAGALLFAATLANVLSVPQPWAFEVLSLAIPVPLAVVGSRLVERRMRTRA
ncbi:MAG: hypothetical protein MUF00_01955 [Gemmatimonadaceae bacterium]|jgi:uncharacterized membrane protein YeiH|nr:hypothetical protein [Gemmatimonadaceae bacterium]